MNNLVRFAVCAWFVVAGTVVAFGQQAPALPGVSEAEASAAPANQADDLGARRKEVAERVLVAERTLDAIDPSAANQNDRADRLQREVDLLKQLDTLYAQRQSADESRRELEATAIELDEELASLRRDGPNEQKPYSFLLLDSLRDKLATAENRAEAMTEAIEAATEELESAKETDDEQQAERRRLKETAEQSTDDDEAAEAALELKLVELEASVAEQSVAVRRAELENVKRSQEIHQVRLTLLEETLACVEKDVVFSKADLRSQLVDIDKQEADLKQEIVDAECTLTGLDQQWTQARHKLAATAKAAPAMVEEEKATRLARYCQTKRIAAARKQLELLGPLRHAWRCRFDLATGDFKRPELASWSRDTARATEQLEFERRLAEVIVSDSRKELADLEDRLESAESQDPAAAKWIAKQEELFSQLVDAQGGHLVTLDAHDNVYHKLNDELRGKLQRQSLWDTLAAGSEVTAHVWNYELTHLGETPVTVGKVVGCIALVVLGIFLSRWFTATFARRVLARFGIQGGAAVAFESLSFYVLVLAWALVALHRMHVPLTIFTFMGGAVAIGVGFGSQKILNNFISGVILLVEQPVRVGDLIEIGSLQGTIANIGTRSTRVRTGTNAEIIIPNSSFLESNVVNWTLGTSTIRCTVRVETAHGSPAKEIVRWLKLAAEQHALVLKRPEPAVSFTDMGSNALSFELSFSIDIRTLGERKKVESDLRFMIDEYFRESGIAFAIPRRDIQLDATRPLEIRMVQPASDALATDLERKAA